MVETQRRTTNDRGVPGTLGVPILIAVGAFAGANLRYAVGLQLPGLAGTLAANIAGSVALGVLLCEATFAGRLSRETRLLVGTGLISSFTTYSTFALGAVTAEPALAIVYVVATYGLGFAGLLGGRAIARGLWGNRS